MDGRTDRQNYDSQDRASIAASRGKYGQEFSDWSVSYIVVSSKFAINVNVTLGLSLTTVVSQIFQLVIYTVFRKKTSPCVFFYNF